ncbi:fatty acyl-CoA reductase wat-like [Sitophilus oryzae]|uniref:Fatty acyl-CoA reductase n=1 Tax=Sitophilus oryzae TaxID=7048 RepID=A0A6J2XZZ8_SITOR|nr:fatty acyl-CoA reductase wat-like [Sitophilus oryzae]XP_030756631.1 fatty acyl-CoA reductase wat-like [Sitophilus oryzae]XP_030756632.1 fatty acyl-CoA reductase wat-like [Sitophilus oryzae]
MLDKKKIPVVFRKDLPSDLEKIKYGHYIRDDWDYPIHLYLKENDIRVDENGSEIVKFLKGKCVLITGATGFLGKSLIEKLLRSCKDIDTIYIVVRAKKGKNIEERVNELLDNWVFCRLADIVPDFRKKVVGINGNFEESDLGLCEKSRNLIADKVNIIFHVAATVRFDEKIKTAVAVNIKGTREMVKIAKSCKKLDVFTYVSSAFSNCHEMEIEEKFYEPLMDPDTLIELTDRFSDDVLDKITPGLLGSTPNTYTFTKQIAESIIKREAIGLPVCMQRPSIVIASVREPIRSWVDNIYGPVGLIQGTAIGLLHVMLGDPEKAADLVPVDYVINNCIAASYKTAKEKSTSEIQIFNFTRSKTNELKWKNLILCSDQGCKVGSTHILWKHFFIFTKNVFFYSLLFFLFHNVPGYIADFFAVKMGKKPLLGKAYEKIAKFSSVLAYFTLREWTFDYSNTVSLWESLNETDKKNFAFDMSSINWVDYFDTYLVAMREFLIMDPLDSLKEGRIFMRRATIFHYVFVSIVTGLSIYFCLKSIFCFIPLGIIFCIIYYNYSLYTSSTLYIKNKLSKK